ncbi:alanine--tRNA ligase [Flavobacteriaceae bacterium]|nr:alanine--tRNA ligase [Flavobacteriaceae bacterium]MDB9941297.1 alanine--tRNA ligase [Flavobacteriaceae bacterium]
MKSAEVRQLFLDFFNEKQHQIVPSAPMVVKDDPTLMFTNAGMNQFKEFFLGNKTPKNKRVSDTQKCLRVSGKHNDLEEVGIDTYHHTFFEMLGNWSFGDYFKEEAIAWAWELLTERYKIDPSILYVTIFEGDESEGLERDMEAYNFWKKFIPEDRILLGNKSDNFWEMGEQGPCGPCSEIHVDIRSEEEKAKVDGATLVNHDHPQVVEVWNLVFIEFNRKADGSLEQLPDKHIDTGMGFERLCMVLQNTTSNYDTDVFTPLIREIEALTKTTYGETLETDRAIRVIADHVRTVYFAIADGQLPSNTGAGYVIRRILRRAIRYGFTFLGQKKAFIHLLVNTLEQQMGDAFPELKREQKLAFNVIREEENSFLKTLDQGLLLLDTILKATIGKVVDGAKAFELYDTYGFPYDLTALIASERGFSVDEAGFSASMEEQKSRSRAAASSKAGDWVVLLANEKEEFVGYDNLETSIKITRYRKMTTAKDGDFYQLVFNQTPFYPEGGGQVGDKGYLEASNGNIHYILNTKKENNLIIHYTETLPVKLEEGFEAVVDAKQRQRTSCNHTATHLLHQALREVLGDHVEQKGSMVHSGMFRFDFSHFAKMTSGELKEVEQFVNARIQEQLPLQENRTAVLADAMAEGAMALFGEKYGDTVRSIRFGKSIELCGGTHTQNTAEIWHFKITSEGAVASGIRRIEAITGDAAKAHFEEQTNLLEQVKAALNQPQDAIKAIENMQTEVANLKKEIQGLAKLQLQAIKQQLAGELETVNGIHFLATEVDLDAGLMKDLAFDLGQNNQALFLVLASKKGGKPILSCYISKELVAEKNLNAGNVVRILGKHIQGGGGGQAFFATAGGKNADGIAAALKAASELI